MKSLLNMQHLTNLLTSVWQTSKYENMLRQLTVEEFEEYNSRAKEIEIG
ncbi:hypothetical protein KZO01_21020 [Kurthia zopfii]|nr:hypothetical protein [Kurthia zopfii]GEK31793.1 hypothetical protein KZO01_21020 [Kurthia zopfii]